MQPKRRKIIRYILTTILALFVCANIVAFFQAWKFTHFTDADISRTKPVAELSVAEKIKTLVFGIDNPKPANHAFPSEHYEVVKLQSNKMIECWSIKTNAVPKGTVILCHGYSTSKASLLDKSDIFLQLGYNTLLVDFMGSGGSEGNQTTIGYEESQEVYTCMDYLLRKGEENIYLFGSSMGAVAIMKAVGDYQLSPKGIILECPFGTMYQTVAARFHTFNIPTFPMVGLLVFWGGTQNGFWAFSHNPAEYAKSINSPVLLLYGEKDVNVSRMEINDIYNNLHGSKQLITYPLAGHDNYLDHYEKDWINDVGSFLKITQ